MKELFDLSLLIVILLLVVSLVHFWSERPGTAGWAMKLVRWHIEPYDRLDTKVVSAKLKPNKRFWIVETRLEVKQDGGRPPVWQVTNYSVENKTGRVHLHASGYTVDANGQRIE